MKRIQIIGLPGSGKSTGIHKFLRSQERYKKFRHLDIRFFQGLNKEQALVSAIDQSLLDVIAESVCGVRAKSNIVIRVQESLPTIYDRLLLRDGHIDENYLSLLAGQITSADFTVTSSDDLPGLLKLIFETG